MLFLILRLLLPVRFMPTNLYQHRSMKKRKRQHKYKTSTHRKQHLCLIVMRNIT
jgi:hypothetical protein